MGLEGLHAEPLTVAVSRSGQLPLLIATMASAASRAT